MSLQNLEKVKHLFLYFSGYENYIMWSTSLRVLERLVIFPLGKAHYNFLCCSWYLCVFCHWWRWYYISLGAGTWSCFCIIRLGFGNILQQPHAAPLVTSRPFLRWPIRHMDLFVVLRTQGFNPDRSDLIPSHHLLASYLGKYVLSTTSVSSSVSRCNDAYHID